MDQREIMLKGGWLTANEAAKRVGVNPATIYRMISSGKVETGRAGQLLFVKAISLAEHYREAPPIFDRIMEGVETKGNGAAQK
jgi:excisionase family DNA binding protein